MPVECQGRKSKSANPYCPYKLLQEYIDIRPHSTSEIEQFFVFADRSPVTPLQARETLKTMITRISFQSRLYNFYSLRIDRCSDLLKYGVSVETIKKIGHWKSNAVFSYLKE